MPSLINHWVVWTLNSVNLCSKSRKKSLKLSQTPWSVKESWIPSDTSGLTNQSWKIKKNSLKKASNKMCIRSRLSLSSTNLWLKLVNPTKMRSIRFYWCLKIRMKERNAMKLSKRITLGASHQKLRKHLISGNVR